DLWRTRAGEDVGDGEGRPAVAAGCPDAATAALDRGAAERDGRMLGSELQRARVEQRDEVQGKVGLGSEREAGGTTRVSPAARPDPLPVPLSAIPDHDRRALPELNRCETATSNS